MSLGNVISISSGSAFPTYHGRVTTHAQTGGGTSSRFLTVSWTGSTMSAQLFSMSNTAGVLTGMTASGGGLQVTNAGNYRVRALATLGFTATNNLDNNTSAALANLSACAFVNGTISSRGYVVLNNGMASADAGQFLFTVDEILTLAANDVVTFRWDGATLGNFGSARYQSQMNIESMF
jgi:hypothetical protein